MTHDVSRRALLGTSGLAAAASFLPPLLAVTEKPTVGSAQLTFQPLELKLTHTWTIARGSSDAKKNGLLKVVADGVTGYGEAAANVRWKQSYDTAEAKHRDK